MVCDAIEFDRFVGLQIFPEKLVPIYQAVRRHTAEENNLASHRH